MRLIFCLHNHQPEGTPTDGLEEAYTKAYLPTLKTIVEHPSIRVVLHNSGCLLENFLLQKEEYVALIRKLLDRGQVELLSSAIYEPILPAISERDRVSQIWAYNDLIERNLGWMRLCFAPDRSLVGRTAVSMARTCIHPKVNIRNGHRATGGQVHALAGTGSRGGRTSRGTG